MSHKSSALADSGTSFNKGGIKPFFGRCGHLYAIDIHKVGFDRDHLHILCRFLQKYSGGQVIGMIKSIPASHIFKFIPSIKKDLWGGEFWTDGYYIATTGGKGNKAVIEQYIRNQGRDKDTSQLKLFNI